MKPNKPTFIDDEINFKEITSLLLKEKFLILVTTLIFTVAGYIYGTLQPSVYQTTITIRDAPNSAFFKYSLFGSAQQQYTSIALSYNQEFKLNLTSTDHLRKFVEKNKKLDEFKSYLEKNSINSVDYFQDNIKLKLANNKTNQYMLIFPKPFLGEEFLNDYVIYTKQTTKNIFAEQLKVSIQNQIEIYEKNLEFAKKYDLESQSQKNDLESSIFKMLPNNNSNVNLNEIFTLFYKGHKILSQQTIFLRQMLNEVEVITFDYDPILDRASSSTLISYSTSKIMSLMFVVGIFFSLIIIFIRSTFSR